MRSLPIIKLHLLLLLNLMNSLLTSFLSSTIPFSHYHKPNQTSLVPLLPHFLVTFIILRLCPLDDDDKENGLYLVFQRRIWQWRPPFGDANVKTRFGKFPLFTSILFSDLNETWERTWIRNFLVSNLQVSWL